MHPTPTRRRNGQDGVVVAEATCPTCASPISMERLTAILGKLRAHDAEIDRAAEARFALREAAIRKQATRAATAALTERIKKAEQAKQAVEQQIKKLRADQDAALRARLEAERDTATKRLTQAVNAERTKGLAERLKLTEQLEALRSRLERRDRPAGQLGEESELDAFMLLSQRFSADGDEITRTKKFARGGDIEHRIANGAGLILYEIKNHQQYQSKWTARAKENQLAAEADHVVVVTNTFPANHRELMLSDDGVLVVSPQRLLAVALWLRVHTIRSHSLRLSNQHRQAKAVRLYNFMSSDRVEDRWGRMAQTVARMRDALRSERLSHEKAWGDRSTQLDVIAEIRSGFIEDLNAIFEATDLGDVS